MGDITGVINPNMIKTYNIRSELILESHKTWKKLNAQALIAPIYAYNVNATLKLLERGIFGRH